MRAVGGLHALERVKDGLEMAVRELLYWRWVLSSRRRTSVSLDTDAKVTIIIPAYASERVRNLVTMIQQLLRCDFVAKIIISCNNPKVNFQTRLRIEDSRLTLRNQPVRRGPGSVWGIAACEEGDYFVVLDDDLLVYPSQVATIFQKLIDQPEVPHGIVGRDGSRYLVGREAEVDDLFNAYAVTRSHVSRYWDYVDKMVAEEGISAETVEFWADDIVISRTGAQPARIHDVGFVSFCRTGLSSSVALFKQEGFEQHRADVRVALERVLAEDRSSPPAKVTDRACGA